MPGQFDDLIPQQQKQAAPPPTGHFDDLIPAKPTNAFADLIPSGTSQASTASVLSSPPKPGSSAAAPSPPKQGGTLSPGPVIPEPPALAAFRRKITGDNGLVPGSRGTFIMPTGLDAKTGKPVWAVPEAFRSLARGALDLAEEPYSQSKEIGKPLNQDELGAAMMVTPGVPRIGTGLGAKAAAAAKGPVKSVPEVIPSRLALPPPVTKYGEGFQATDAPTARQTEYAAAQKAALDKAGKDWLEGLKQRHLALPAPKGVAGEGFTMGADGKPIALLPKPGQVYGEGFVLNKKAKPMTGRPVVLRGKVPYEGDSPGPPPPGGTMPKKTKLNQPPPQPDPVPTPPRFPPGEREVQLRATPPEPAYSPVSRQDAAPLPPPGFKLDAPSEPAKGSPFQEGRKLDDELHNLETNHYRRGIEMAQALESVPKDVPKETWEKLTHYEETPDKVKLTPQEQATYDKYVKPLADRHNELYKEAGKLGLTKADLGDLTPGKIGKLGYTPRFLKNKQNFVQRVISGAKPAPEFGRSLSKQAGQLKGRTNEGSIADIEAQTGEDKYYKHVLVNRAAAVAELERAVENAKFLQKRIPELEANGLIVPKDARDVPSNYITTKVPQLAGRKMEPNIAHALDDFWGVFHKNHTPIGDAYGRINRMIGSWMFLTPFRHIYNVADTWAGAKGASSLVKLSAYARLPRTFARAVDEVRTQGPLYRAILKGGGSLQTARDGMDNLHRVMLKKVGAEVEQNPGKFAAIARAAGYANPVKWARRLISGADDRHVLWAAGDMLYVQHVQSLIDRGASLKEAIAETEKAIVNYRVPSTVYNGPGGRAIAQLYKDPNITFFGRYRYGLLRSYADHIKNLVKPLKPGDRAAAADRLAMMGVLGLVAYPLMDDAVEKVTGNKNARFMRPGLSALPYDLFLAAKGEKDASNILQSLITPAPALTEGPELLYNHDLFSGQPIYDPKNPVAAAAQIGGRELGQSGIFKAGQQVYGGKTDARRVAEQQIGISDPTEQQVGKAARGRALRDREWKRNEARALAPLKKLFGLSQ